MKKFEAPMLEVVYYEKEDIIITSPYCPECNECTQCEEGSNDCMYKDTCPEYCGRDHGPSSFNSFV